MAITHIILTNNDLKVEYAICNIKEIVHSKACDALSVQDIYGNGLAYDESVMQIMFNNGSVASFSSNWVMSFK